MENEEFLQALARHGATSNNWSLLSSVLSKVNRKTGKPINEERAWDILTSVSKEYLRKRGIWTAAFANGICVNPVYARQRAVEEKNSTAMGSECTCSSHIERKDGYFSSHCYNGGRHACTNSSHKANCALWNPPASGHLHSWRRGFDSKAPSFKREAKPSMV